jgi:hypothetical protein
MEPFPFTDAQGRAWHVYDFKVVNSGPLAKKRAVPIGDWSAEARAFVPVSRVGPVLIHNFGLTPYRGTTARTLEQQLHFSKPLGASAAERMQGG